MSTFRGWALFRFGVRENGEEPRGLCGFLGRSVSGTLVYFVNPWARGPRARASREPLRANPTDPIRSRLANPGIILSMHAAGVLVPYRLRKLRVRHAIATLQPQNARPRARASQAAASQSDRSDTLAPSESGAYSSYPLAEAAPAKRVAATNRNHRRRISTPSWGIELPGRRWTFSRGGGRKSGKLRCRAMWCVRRVCGRTISDYFVCAGKRLALTRGIFAEIPRGLMASQSLFV
jgi:hypothetical protein